MQKYKHSFSPKNEVVFFVVVVDFRQNVFYNLKIVLNIGVRYAIKEKHKIQRKQIAKMVSKENIKNSLLTLSNEPFGKI